MKFKEWLQVLGAALLFLTWVCGIVLGMIALRSL